jgi:hypothetical protein
MKKPFVIKSVLSLALCLSALSASVLAADNEPENLALGGKVEVSSRASDDQGGDKITDGLLTNESRWISADEEGPHTATIQLAKTVKIGAVQILSGYYKNGEITAPVRNFAVQYRVSGEWKDVPGGYIRSNMKPFRSIVLTNPVETDALRLAIRDKGTVRVYEVRAYAPAETYPEAQWPMTVNQ